MFRHLISFCALASPAFAQEVEILPGFSDFRVPEITQYDQPMQLVQDWIMNFPETAEGRPRLEVISEFDGELLIIELTESGLADDSVSTVQRRYHLIPSNMGGWTLVSYGNRQQCYRENPGVWVTTPCL